MLASCILTGFKRRYYALCESFIITGPPNFKQDNIANMRFICIKKQEAQLSQSDCAMLRVIEFSLSHSMSFKIIEMTLLSRTCPC